MLTQLRNCRISEKDHERILEYASKKLERRITEKTMRRMIDWGAWKKLPKDTTHRLGSLFYG